MVLAFLRAEVDSPRFREMVSSWLDGEPFLREDLIRRADLSDPAQNAARRRVLRSFRGYGADSMLFPGFPLDVTWRRVQLEQGDAGSLLYARWPEWVQLSLGSRRVTDGAKNGASNPNVVAVANRLRLGETFEPLIAVEGLDGTLILVEGHVRATAFVLHAGLDGVIVILGSSPSLSRWGLY